ncbi:hypothetical protein LEP1GSC103_2811 [Leptospira borgpetersenii serovar Javanica str. UI 09931]|uniref:SLEI domain protein, PF07620 family n=1 Tax=Leptospira borgpetersenii serovar Javanica str. UI 09931 TaxID=1049767 RepID=A0AAV3JCS3_LEPBO|nr:hypothetical protein LEP1GSC121_0595 [Leptospira borgpetersenii serovar Castellonis str. 200801910]EMN59549.1 hypothetical protein LEP1GSC090_1444 [Leptospira borgpetersenii serovar Javanica str. MK146]EPG57732.1 hypothetical protein LEP1GSC103_2811 [Leptospira borgpetersenii serovar Javanica str. UI 09931]
MKTVDQSSFGNLNFFKNFIKVVEKLILHLFPFHENGRLKQFC